MVQPRGQTLIESLIAAAIVVVGVTSLLAALVNARIASDITIDQVTALQLANEALEGVRFIRDSNWLQIENGFPVEFNDRLHHGTQYGGIYLWNPTITTADQAISIGFISGGINHSDAIVYQHETHGYFRQSTAPLPAEYVPTEFRRWVVLYPICMYLDGSPEPEVLTADGTSCADAGREYIQIGIHVTAQVQWEHRGETHQRVVETELYNWKYANERFAAYAF